jgi:hypothetical protein
MSLFEVSKHIVRVVFHNHVLHVHVISGFKGIVVEVVASLVSSLKWASYDLLLMLDSFRDLWYNSTKCLGFDIS